MSQTDIPWTAAAGDDEDAAGWGRRRRSRRSRHTGATSGGHSGEQCRMCGQTVVVDRDGRCRLGHQVVDPEVVAERLSEESVGTREEADEDVVLDVREAPPTPAASEEVAVEITIDADADAPTPALGLPQQIDVDRRWVPGLVIPGARLAAPEPGRVVVAMSPPPAQARPHAPAAWVEPRAEAPLPVLDEPLPPIPLPATAEEEHDRGAADQAPAAEAPPPPTARTAFDVEEGDGPRPIGYDDLSPDAASVLDVGPLAASAPPAERTFEQVPLEEDDEGRAGRPWIASGVLLLIALVGIAVALALLP